MQYLKNDELEKGLKEFKRVYLCGNLKKENGVSHIQTTGYELGISDYPTYSFDKAHVHVFNKEYNYVLEGSIKILVLSMKKEYIFQKGDLFVIDENEPYIGKALPGTRVIFSKVPGGDDKRLILMDEALLRWGKSWEALYFTGDEE